jgi:hypothetical protein
MCYKEVEIALPVSEIILTSKSTKLKMVLLADFIVLALVIPSYFYVDSQIPSPATFQVAGLVVDSDLVQVGELVQVSVNVTNLGGKSGNHSVILLIDNIETATKDVQLSGGVTTTVTFSTLEPTEGNHTVTIEDLTASFQVTSATPTKPAELQLTNLVTNRKEAEVGNPITVSVTATNTGDETGEFSLELFVNDQKRETKTIQLDGGETSSVRFEIVENVEGDYAVKLGSLTTSFKITSQAQSVKPAEFQVTDLTVNPSTVLAGEAVQIAVNVTNVGEETGSFTVSLKIDGATRNTLEVTLAGQANDIVNFEVTEANIGTHNVQADGLSGSFTVEAPVAASKNIILKRVFVNPYEVWEGETVTVTVKANNTVNEEGTLSVKLLVEGEAIATKQLTVAPGDSNATLQFTIIGGKSNPETTKGYPIEAVNLGNRSNTLNGYYVVAPDGYHTLAINRAGGGSKPMVFELNGVTYESPYIKLLPVGEYSISTDKIVDVVTGVVEFTHWSDGVESESRTLILDRKINLLAYYIVISGYASCPSLYTWNGTGYNYVTEVSNAGWLGYIDYINEDGDIIFGGGNPWDHVKLDKNQLQIRTDNGQEYYDLVLFQQWDEIFYLDTAYLVAVDHPDDIDVYSTMVNYVNRGFYGEVYTINPDNLLIPLSATNEKAEDVLSQIAQLDGIFSKGINGVESPSWDNIKLNQLTVDLGDLSGAPEIKLVINGMVDWGPPEPYYDWIDQFKVASAEGVVANGTKIYPPSSMEVMDAQGNWIRVPQDRQMPIPGDYVPRTFAVDLNGLFPADANEYKIRITNFWNVTFDYIGIDISPQRNITVNEILPTATLEPLDFGTTNSNVSGYFTKYGDVTPLLLSADDIFVIGMQGDRISLKFPTAELPPLGDGMERSFFFFVASWFKDPPGNWGYGFDFTVDPLPFRAMSGFPYPDTESYPSSEKYVQYLKEWNTRTVNVYEKDTGIELAAELMKFTALAGVAIAGVLVTLIWKNFDAKKEED